MKDAFRGTLTMMVVLLVASACAGQSASGPATGSKVEPLKALAITGPDAGHEVDLAAGREKMATIFVFIQADKWDRPLARFLRTLDQELNQKRSDVSVFAVWLTSELENTKDYLPRIQGSLSLSQTTLAVFPASKNGPTAWSLSDSAHLTVVIADKAKVIASNGYRSVNELDVPPVLEKLPAAK
jgi:hypothetical protein